MTTAPTVTGPMSLSNGIFSDTIQVCVVTRDYRRTMSGMVQAGIGPWRVYTFDSDTTLTDTQIRGVKQPLAMKLCMAFVGATMWEVVQPLKGPTIYEEFLERHGEGLHHVAVACGTMSWAERVKSLEERGFACIQSGVWVGQVPWAYFATEEATTTIIEIYDIPEGFELPEPEEWYPAPPPA
ncbi:MAG: VOC family protein [Pseudomonadota bacterium]